MSGFFFFFFLGGGLRYGFASFGGIFWGGSFGLLRSSRCSPVRSRKSVTFGADEARG